MGRFLYLDLSLALGERGRSTVLFMKDITPENNVDSLNAYWQDNACYDVTIKDIRHLRNRCVIVLGDNLLLCDGVSDVNSTVSAFPTRLFEPSLVWANGRVELTLTTHAGVCKILCGKVRLYNHVLNTRLV